MLINRITRPAFYHRGATLVELMVFIVVVSVALGGLLGVYRYAVLNSAKPAKYLRMLQYAQARLDAVMALRYDENTPSGGVPACGSANPKALPCTNSKDANMDDVDDYNGVTDNPDPNSSFYHRTVSVQPLTFNGQAAKLIQVRVTANDGESLTLAGYRVNF